MALSATQMSFFYLVETSHDMEYFLSYNFEKLCGDLVAMDVIHNYFVNEVMERKFVSSVMKGRITALVKFMSHNWKVDYNKIWKCGTCGLNLTSVNTFPGEMNFSSAYTFVSRYTLFGQTCGEVLVKSVLDE